MPEGPEVRIEADKIAKTVVGKKLKKVWFAFSDLNKKSNRLRNSEISRVYCKGKGLLITFKCNLSIFTHNQLYGKWYFTNSNSKPKTNRTLRLELSTDTRSALLYSASTIEILTESGVAEHTYLNSLGLDVLDLETTVSHVYSVFKKKEFNARKVAALYLQQKFLAGIGNYLRSEILFYAKINPFLKLNDLSKAQVKRLGNQSLAVPRRSYESKGNTLSKTLFTRAKGRSRFAVFGREGKGCYSCGSKIAKVILSSRRLYYCPNCQSVS